MCFLLGSWHQWFVQRRYFTAFSAYAHQLQRNPTKCLFWMRVLPFHYVSIINTDVSLVFIQVNWNGVVSNCSDGNHRRRFVFGYRLRGQEVRIFCRTATAAFLTGTAGNRPGYTGFDRICRGSWYLSYMPSFLNFGVIGE